ncbi:hypothetical protein [Chitinophaga pinensis]|uniref:Uncharacterized protein n=1 Tax=Chitinophaga pinensis TaxID=79329 RepID=A0A5C6LN63_9BACT|nr:hypothetical protein [Chitinophaga pinensis]TWV97360.1 hypothetical protein FEF09_22120 [Chitinophaga pinensis]
MLIAALNQQNDTIEKYYRQLPSAIKMSPFSDHYTVTSGNTTDQYTVDDFLPGILLLNSWQQDSARLHVQNPLKLPFWYSILNGKKVIERGYNDALHWQGSTKHNKQYVVYVNYIWANKINEKVAELLDPGGKLHVEVTTPRTVYPGQTADININVTDKYQQPVAGVDVTAFGYTSKFPEKQNIISAPSHDNLKKDILPLNRQLPACHAPILFPPAGLGCLQV